MILDFSENFFFFYLKANIEGKCSNDKNNTSDFHYTELTPLGKVWQNKTLRLISYSTVVGRRGGLYVFVMLEGKCLERARSRTETVELFVRPKKSCLFPVTLP